MAVTCTPDAIATAAQCYAYPCMNEVDRAAIGVLLAAYRLNTAGGTDYRTNLDQLFQDSVGYQVVGHSVYSAADLALDLGHTAGAPSTVDTLLAAVKCIRCRSLKEFRKARQFLKCAAAAAG